MFVWTGIVGIILFQTLRSLPRMSGEKDSSQELLNQCQGKMRRPKVDHRGRLVRDCEGNVELEDKETELKIRVSLNTQFL